MDFVQLIQKKANKDGSNENQLKDGVVSEDTVSVTAGEGKKETKIEKVEEGRAKEECEVVCVEDCEGEEEEGEGGVEEMEREGEIEGKQEEDGDENVSTTSPPVHEIDYLSDLTELPKHWKSTNTQSLGELWYHLLKQVPTVYHTCTYVREHTCNIHLKYMYIFTLNACERIFGGM